MIFKKFFKLLKKTFRFKKTFKKKARAKNKIIKKYTAKKVKKKTVVKPEKIKAKKIKKTKIGVVTHYFSKARAAVVKLSAGLTIGDAISVETKYGEFRQTVASMQIDRKPIEKATKGAEIGLEIFKEVKEGDIVYRNG